MMNRLSLIAAMALLVAGCGDDPGVRPTTPSSPTPGSFATGQPSPGKTGVFTGTATPPAGDSGIRGIVLIGPQCPVVREGEDCPDKPFQAIIGIRDAAGRAIASTASGVDGRFEIALPAGTYLLVARPPTDTTIPAPVEISVVVEPSRFTEIVVSMDSGIR
jgi:hypothetical protein